MRISATIIVILLSTYIVSASVLDPVIENVVHLQASKPPKGVGGMWKKKTIWKPRWIKEWKSAKVMKPVWKKIWSPVQIKEWVPIPKPPPGWESISTPLALIHPKPKSPSRDSAGYGSYPVQATSNIPLWDPVPYPESQQPPPPPIYPDNAHSAAFNEEQISGIIGARYNEFSPEYSETVNHLTRLPVAKNWMPPQPIPNFQNYPPLPEYLIPPQYQTLGENNPRHQEQDNRPAFQVEKSVGKWIPLPPENKPKAPDTPYRFHLPEILIKNNTNNPPPPQKEKPSQKANTVSEGFRHPTDGDFIQEAELVGEFHYSEFDLSKKVEQGQEKQDERNAPKKEAGDKPKQNYPVYERPDMFFIPPNHRFAPVGKSEAGGSSNETTTRLHPVAPHATYKNASLQLVYPTAPQTAPEALYKTYSYNATDETAQTTTDKPSTPFSIVFPSSFEEEVTKSPVFIVTPTTTDSP